MVWCRQGVKVQALCLNGTPLSIPGFSQSLDSIVEARVAAALKRVNGTFVPLRIDRRARVLPDGDASIDAAVRVSV